MWRNETHQTTSPKAREECRLLGESGTYGKIAGSLENVKQLVERIDCSDVGGGERKREPRILLSFPSLYRNLPALKSRKNVHANNLIVT